ncbi:hypothetical protein LDL77_10900 [Flagellimonas marinaquae]|nr:hypothetical protein LDL77_10900 [Allomuricauda aquimarina]
MFERICIKDKKSESYRLDIGFLIDTILFYGKVIVIAHKEELNILFSSLGENLIKELINSDRLEIKFKENHLGSMIFPDGKYSVDTFSSQNVTLDSILYQIHREKVNNSQKNLKFSSEFSQLITPYKYGKEVRENIVSDFNNVELLSKTLPLYINSIVPNFQLPEKIEIEIIKDGNFGPYDAYSLNSNIDLKELNKTHKLNKPEVEYDIDYSGFLLSMAESKGDIHLASDLDSELVTSELYSKFIEVELNELIAKRAKSETELNLFKEYSLANCTSLGSAFVNGILTEKELLKIFEKSDKFREWLSKIPEDGNLLGEYHKAVISKDLSDKLPTKTARFVIFEGIGITLDLLGAGGIGTAVATSLALGDTFLLDRIINRKWKPNQFIDNTLKPKIKV